MLSKFDLIGVGVMLSPNPIGQVSFFFCRLEILCRVVSSLA